MRSRIWWVVCTFEKANLIRAQRKCQCPETESFAIETDHPVVWWERTKKKLERRLQALRDKREREVVSLAEGAYRNPVALLFFAELAIEDLLDYDDESIRDDDTKTWTCSVCQQEFPISTGPAYDEVCAACVGVMGDA